MKTLINIKTRSIIIAVFFLLIFSCSFVQANLIKEGSLQLEVVPSSVKISSVRAYQESDKVAILGELSQQNCNAEPVNGHVDIAFFSPEKKLMQKISANYGGKKEPLPRRGGHHHNKHFNRTFKTAISIVPPQGAIIKIAFHNIPLDGAALTDCGQNMAAL
jgi:hypothetical protein